VLDISLAGLIGAVVGTIVAGVNYHLFIGALERGMRKREETLSPEDRDRMDAQMSLLRRVVLTADLFVFAALGYWIGMTFWG
jgi:hypothetical protein